MDWVIPLLVPPLSTQNVSLGMFASRFQPASDITLYRYGRCSEVAEKILHEYRKKHAENGHADRSGIPSLSTSADLYNIHCLLYILPGNTDDFLVLRCHLVRHNRRFFRYNKKHLSAALAHSHLFAAMLQRGSCE